MGTPSRPTAVALEPALLVAIAACVGVAAVLLIGPVPGAHGGGGCPALGCGSGGGGGGSSGQTVGFSLTAVGWMILLGAAGAVVAVSSAAVVKQRRAAHAADAAGPGTPWYHETPAQGAEAAASDRARVPGRVRPVHLLVTAVAIVLVAWLLFAVLPPALTGAACWGGFCEPGHGGSSAPWASGGSGSGAGGGSGNSTGNGSGNGTGGGTGNGTGSGLGNGTGGGSGNGTGGGSGNGTGGGSGNGTGSGSGNGTGKGSGNGTGGGSGGGSGDHNKTKNGTGGAAGGKTVPPQSSSQLTLSLPIWGILVLAVVSAGAIGVWLASRALARRDPAGDESPPLPPAPAEAEGSASEEDRVLATVLRAQGDFERDPDPRGAIVSLYGRLLAELHPKVGSVASSTPEEIRLGHLQRLGVPAPTAELLTRLFETARYSTHEIGKDDVGRFGDALHTVVQDLRSRVVGDSGRDPLLGGRAGTAGGRGTTGRALRGLGGPAPQASLGLR